MSFINYAAKEINCKIIYYGPGLGGKTTNLQYIYNQTSSREKGQLVSLPGPTERTIFFDFLPLNIGEVRGFKVRFHLYTVPGQQFYDASRSRVLNGVDGAIFVADSQVERMEDNIDSFKSLDSNLRDQGFDLREIPFALQYNKRDLQNPIPLKVFRDEINTFGAPDFEAVAKEGVGVFDTLKAVSKSMLKALAS